MNKKLGVAGHPSFGQRVAQATPLWLARRWPNVALRTNTKKFTKLNQKRINPKFLEVNIYYQIVIPD
jgi:hypothetical protein